MVVVGCNGYDHGSSGFVLKVGSNVSKFKAGECAGLTAYTIEDITESIRTPAELSST